MAPHPIQLLPTELLSQIISYLAGPAPSDTRLHDQPSLSMLSDPDSQTLKSVSRVSKRWRAIALPFLFRHALWVVDIWYLLVNNGTAIDQATGESQALRLERFLRENNLGHYVESLTLSLRDDEFRRMECGPRNNPPHRAAGSSDQGEELEDLGGMSARARAGGGSMWKRTGSRKMDWNWLWTFLFGIMDPKRLTIIASPGVLARLLSTKYYTEDAWCFRNQPHILSLERGKPIDHSVDQRVKRDHSVQASTEAVTGTSNGSEGRNDASRTNGPTTNLFAMRPWQALLLNEGSFLRAYKTYEFYHRRAPSILGSLLGCRPEVPNDTPLIPPTIRSLFYVAIFPLSSHFNSLVGHLPPVDRLFVQLVPRNNILDDRDEMDRIQPGDLWMERNTCYSLVIRQLFEGTLNIDPDEEELEEPRENGWGDLTIFESGDAADREAWEMAVEYVRMSGTPWHVERDGVFVRHPEQTHQTTAGGEDVAPHLEFLDADDELTEEEPLSADEGFELFKAPLMRLAFNGTEHLPYSPARQYAADEELF